MAHAKGLVYMNILEFFVKLQNRRKKFWIETTATFTGKRNKAASRTKVGFRELAYYEYEISYFVDGKEKRVYYSFYPLPDPEIENITGKTIRIKYNKKKPYLFETTE